MVGLKCAVAEFNSDGEVDIAVMINKNTFVVKVRGHWIDGKAIVLANVSSTQVNIVLITKYIKEYHMNNLRYSVAACQTDF